MTTPLNSSYTRINYCKTYYAIKLSEDIEKDDLILLKSSFSSTIHLISPATDSHVTNISMIITPKYCHIPRIWLNQKTDIIIAVNGSILENILVSTADMYFILDKNNINATVPINITTTTASLWIGCKMNPFICPPYCE